MAKIIEITNTGAQALSLADTLAEVQRRYKNKIGEDLARSPQTPQAQIAGVNAGLLSEITEAIVQVSGNNSVDHAGGVPLTDLGSFLDLRKAPASYSRVTATLTGVAATGLPAGSRARTADGDIFETQAAVILAPAGVLVEMQAVEPGPVPAPTASLTQIVSVTPGWETVTNANEAALGADEESDVNFRMRYRARTGRLASGSTPALEAALEESLVTKRVVEENKTNATAVKQSWTIDGHSLLVVARGGTDGDIRRAIETHRGQGVGTMTAVLGGTPDETALALIADGTVTWNGTDYTGLDLTAATTPALKAAALTTLLDGTGVTVSSIGNRYVAIFPWQPGQNPQFGQDTVEEAFGLDPEDATYPPGPFIRPQERALTISFTAARRAGFPADGLQLLRAAVNEVIEGYEIGEEIWSNDILRAVEGIPGTRITLLSVQYDSSDVSGLAVPLDVLWVLPAANLTITIS